MNIISLAVKGFGSENMSYLVGYDIERIELYKNIYAGNPPWSYVKKSGLYGKGVRRMSMLSCARVICDNLAQLTFSNQVDIQCDNEKHYEFLMKTLQENNFWANMPAFLSKAYALGGGTIKVLVSDNKVLLDYVDASAFIPCGYSGRGITEGIFASTFRKGNHNYVLLEKHSMKDGYVVCDRVLFLADKGYSEQRVNIGDVLEGLEEHSEYRDIHKPLFSYFRSAECNNFDLDSVLGISCFANSVDTLKALDVAFDSFSREFILGRKRIIVPSSCIRTVVDTDTGQVRRYFDSDDEVYQALKCDEEKDLKIIDNTTELRVEEHVDSINALLDVICFQTGLSSGTLSFSSSGGVKTAEEIKSIETRTELTMQNNRNLAVELIENVCSNIINAGIMVGAIANEPYSVRARFSDNQTIDKDTEIERNISLVNAGLKSKVKAIMELNDCTEEEAKRELERIRLEGGEENERRNA